MQRSLAIFTKRSSLFWRFSEVQANREKPRLWKVPPVQLA